MATWYAVYEDATGKLRSTGTVISDPLKPGLTKLELAGEPKDDEIWDETQRKFVAAPPARILSIFDELPDTPAMRIWYGQLTQQQKDDLAVAFSQLYGRQFTTDSIVIP